MNRNDDRWRHCYWKEWLLIKKRRDELHATRPKGAEDGASRNKVSVRLTAAHLGDRLEAGGGVRDG